MARPTEQAKRHFRSMQLDVTDDMAGMQKGMIALSFGLESLATAIGQVYQAIEQLERRMDVAEMNGAGGHRRPSM